MTPQADLTLCDNLEQASRHAAALTAKAAQQAVAERGVFRLAVSGGSTPGRYFELLTGEDVPWNATRIFWVDERCVPPDDPRSNYGAARRALLSRLPAPPAGVHRVRGELPAPQAARLYREDLADHFGWHDIPVFDCIHLGLGGDGHTASLFPGSPALSERDLWAVDVLPDKADPPVQRVTLTLPVLNAARLVFFLASGADKTGLARQIAAGEGGAYPAALVKPQGTALWLVAE